jgi:hypothetical protein
VSAPADARKHQLSFYFKTFKKQIVGFYIRSLLYIVMPKHNNKSRRRFNKSHSAGQSQGQGRQQRDDEAQDRIQQNQNTQQQRQSIATKPTFVTPKQSIPKTVAGQQKTYSKKPQTQRNTPNAPLPNLDDINDEFNNSGRLRRQVTYDEHYGTTDPVNNRLKDKYKRSKLRKKKSTGLLGEINTKSGNSILDSYKRLGNKLRR